MEYYGEVIQQLGVGAGFFLLCLFLLKWAVSHWEKISSDATTERKEWLEQIQKMEEKRIRQEEKSMAQETRVNEAHEFQRQEHTRLVDTLKDVSFSLKALNGKT